MTSPASSTGLSSRSAPSLETIGGVDERLEPAEVTGFVQKALAGANLDCKRICLVVPHGTRTCPLPMLLQGAREELAGRAQEVTVVIALGTHQGMAEEHLASHLGYHPGQAEDTHPRWRILNHELRRPETFTSLGTIGVDPLTELTDGLLTDTSLEVKINRHVAEADVAIVVGPVFPHEVPLGELATFGCAGRPQHLLRRCLQTLETEEADHERRWSKRGCRASQNQKAPPNHATKCLRRAGTGGRYVSVQQAYGLVCGRTPNAQPSWREISSR